MLVRVRGHGGGRARMRVSGGLRFASPRVVQWNVQIGWLAGWLKLSGSAVPAGILALNGCLGAKVPPSSLGQKCKFDEENNE